MTTWWPGVSWASSLIRISVHNLYDVVGQREVGQLALGEPPYGVRRPGLFGPQGPAPRRHAIDEPHGVQVRLVGQDAHVGEHVEQGAQHDRQSCFLFDLPAQGVGRMFAVVHPAPGQEPPAAEGQRG